MEVIKAWDIKAHETAVRNLERMVNFNAKLDAKKAVDGSVAGNKENLYD